MNKKFLSLLLLGGSLFMVSCIQDEAPNAECDITGVDTLWLKSLEPGTIIGNPIIENETITFTLKYDADRSSLAPKFYLTPGASITAEVDGCEVPANGITRDFNEPKDYIVHSEDGMWHHKYTVSFELQPPPSDTPLITTFSFEHFELDASQRYYQWMEYDETDVSNPKRNYWATGNAGFKLTGMGQLPEDYPTSVAPLGVNGNCVKLVTRDTGSFGLAANMPIAAGNLFIGEFRIAQAMLKPLEATRFGLQQLVRTKPLKLSGYYKYTAGEVFTDKKKQVRPELEDTADIYAVLYEVDPAKFVTLNGANVLSSDRIVLMARIDEPGEPQEWTHFEEPFKPMNGKTFDEERLRNNGYAITVVATSSRQGAYFEGAVGSTLYVDEIKIHWEGEED